MGGASGSKQRQGVGRRGEELAAAYLQELGYELIARNWRTRAGELDIIAFEKGVLVFLEVKTRGSRQFGEPWEFVDREKQQILRRTAEEFIADQDLGDYAYRFDIISVVGTDVEHFRNAF